MNQTLDRPAPVVLISEVGPRDGLQSVPVTMPTAAKLRWIDALVASGIREIEVASFVPAILLPQMADAGDVVHHALTHKDITVMALGPLDFSSITSMLSSPDCASATSITMLSAALPHSIIAGSL